MSRPRSELRRSVDRLPPVVASVPSSRPRRRLFALALTAALTAGLAVAPSAMADVLAPESGGSPNANQIADLYQYILIVAAIVFVGVESALIYSIVKYRRRRNPVADQIHGNTNLEIGWTVGAALILVVLATITFVMLPGIRNPPNSDAAGLNLNSPQYRTNASDGRQPPNGKSLNITVNGQQYVWRFTYPDGDTNALNNVFAYETMVVPTNTTVTLNIRGQDVIHSWWIPSLGGKFDAVPGYTNHTWFKISKPGVYTGQCAELCGRNHANMVAAVRAVPPAVYQAWYQSKRKQIERAGAAVARDRPTIGTPRSQGKPLPAQVTAGAAAKPGAATTTAAIDAKSLFVKGKGAATACGSCHTLAAAGTTGAVGPNLNTYIEKGDDVAAIKEMILKPNAEIAKGYAKGIMPLNYGQTLTPAEIDALATYIYENTR